MRPPSYGWLQLRLVCAALVLARRVGARYCSFGSLAGTWRAFEAAPLPGRGTHETLSYNRLDDSAQAVWLQTSAESPEAPFGGNWRTLDPACPLRNLLREYWRSVPAAGGANVTIVLLGDSVDAYFLDYLCIEASRRNVTGWAAYVHSKALVNYCVLPSGLRLVQVYLLRQSVADDLRRVELVRRLFAGDDDVSAFDGLNGDRAVLQGRAAETAALAATPPALVVLSSCYWPLNNFASAFGDEQATPTLLPPAFVDEFTIATRMLLAAARAAFPAAQLTVHTSGGIRTDPQTGTNVDASNKRIWGKKAYVAQLNAALRHAAHAERCAVVDLELMAAALAPGQLTVDDLHPRGFFSLEVLNVYLNIIVAEAGQRGEGLRARERVSEEERRSAVEQRLDALRAGGQQHHSQMRML
jgi:hypothetical protein